MQFIQNVSFDDVRKAWHYDPGPNSVLIQIVDPDMNFPTPLFNFKETHQFKFLDIEEDHPWAIDEKQAQEIADILMKAKNARSNVIVHCVAGICRSGAVAEAGVALGFADTETYRHPNLRVKSMVMKHLWK